MLYSIRMKKNAAFAVFKEREEVDRAFIELKAEGFRPEEVSVVLPEHDGARDFAASDHMTRIKQGALTGGGTGLIVGLGLGLLAGYNLLPLVIIAPFNPMMGALLVGFFGMILGAASGALVGIGTPADPTERYAAYLDDGGILVSVHVEDAKRARRVMEILERNNGTDISEINEDEAWRGVFAHKNDFRPSVTH